MNIPPKFVNFPLYSGFLETFLKKLFQISVTMGKSIVRKLRHFTVAIYLLLTFTSCANLRVISKYDSDNPVPVTVTRVAYFWGLQQPVDVVTGPDCKSMCQVKVKTNFGQVFLSAITLGIVIPQTMEYYCCATEPKPGEIEP
jgi:hypothetical protein